MLKVKRILFLFLAVLLMFAIASCGGGAKPCDTCVDCDGDGICECCECLDGCGNLSGDSSSGKTKRSGKNKGGFGAP